MQTVVGAHHGHQLVFHKRYVIQHTLAASAFYEPKVYFMRQKGLFDFLGIPVAQIDGRMEPVFRKKRQRLRQDILGDGGACADTERSARFAGDFLHFIFQGGICFEYAFNVFQHALSGMGEQQPAAGALEQPLAVFRFQFADMTGYRWLRHIELFRRFGKAEMACGRTEHF